MNKLLILCGPTAVGKTSLGIELAKKFSGEIVSADSKQVYREMDVGTGKELPVNAKLKSQNSKLKLKSKNFKIGYYLFKSIPIWMLDIVEPNYRFNVADYKKCAEVVMEDIWKRGKLPIIVGGTGFYIKAITDGIETIGIEPDWELRNELQRRKVSELQRMLEDYSPERSRGMNESDRKNPRRLIRAIEIAQNLKSQMSNVKTKCQMSNIDKLFVGLTVPNNVLYQRIDQRVEERIRMGVEEEIRDLLKKGYNWMNSVLGTTIAYKEWQDYFEGKVKKEEVIQKWKFNEHSYSRRQMTWFRKNPEINWFDITKEGWQVKVEKLVKSWYS